MKKRTVNQAEYDLHLQLLIHEISHDDSCQIYIFVVHMTAVTGMVRLTGIWRMRMGWGWGGGATVGGVPNQNRC